MPFSRNQKEILEILFKYSCYKPERHAKKELNMIHVAKLLTHRSVIITFLENALSH